MLPRLSAIALALIELKAMAAVVPPASNATDYYSRATGQFLAGDNQQLGGFGDAMVPLVKKTNEFLFVDGSLLLGQSARSTYSGGLGYRGIVNTPAGGLIAGAFLFSDYYQTALRTNQWLLNPGLECLGTQYEARLQGYFPLGQQNKIYAPSLASNLTPSELANANTLLPLSGATGHQLFDTPVNLIEAYGNGGELEVGRHFDYADGMWLRVGGYHFSYQSLPDINGVQANIEMNVSQHTSFILQNNYDNQNKNRFSIGLRVNFGGSEAPPETLASRLTTPIIRHQSRQSYGEAVPTWQSFKVSGPRINVLGSSVPWFFSPSGTAPPGLLTTLDSCTAEHPCNSIDSLTAAKIQELTPGASLLFATGSYAIPSHPLTSLNGPTLAADNANWVTLQDGQSVLGRNAGWLTDATDSSSRPQINGGLFWGDDLSGLIANGILNNTVVLNENQLIPSSASGINDAVIAAGATGSLTMSNDFLTATTADASSTIAVAGYAGRDLTVNGGSYAASAVSSGDSAEATGLWAVGNATLSDVTINGNAEGNAFTIARGLFTDASSNTIVNGGSQSVTAVSNDATLAEGIAGGNMTINNNISIVEVTSQSNNATATGINSSGDVSIENTITRTKATGIGSTAAQSIGIRALNDATIANSIQIASAFTQNAEATTNGINIGSSGGTSNGVISGGAQLLGAISTAGNATVFGITANDVTVNAMSSLLFSQSTGAGVVTGWTVLSDNAVINDANFHVTLVADSGSAVGFGATAYQNMVVNGGGFNVSVTSNSGLAAATGVYSGQQDLTIKGGTFNVTATTSSNTFDATSVGANANTHDLTIEGGTYNITAKNLGSNAAYSTGAAAQHDQMIKGGTFNITATSNSGVTQGIGALAANIITVDGSIFNVTDTSSAGGSLAWGVVSVAAMGSVSNTMITVTGSGANKCIGVTSPDGSCS